MQLTSGSEGRNSNENFHQMFVVCALDFGRTRTFLWDEPRLFCF